MKVLAFDTSMKACSAAVLIGGEGEGKLFRAFETRDRGHMERLLPMIEQILAEAGIDYADLDRIAVTTGPGTFTGVRIGIAGARALALATGLPLVGATSLQVMAFGLRDLLRSARAVAPLKHAIAIAVDARRGEIYFQLFAPDLSPISGPEALTVEAAAGLLPEMPVKVAGSAATGLAAIADRPGRAVCSLAGDLQPDAAVLARIAKDLAPADELLRPLYLRAPDAKSQADKILPRRS